MVRNEDYGSRYRLYKDSAEKRPDNARARGLYERVLSAQPPLTVSTDEQWVALATLVADQRRIYSPQEWVDLQGRIRANAQVFQERLGTLAQMAFPGDEARQRRPEACRTGGRAVLAGLVRDLALHI